MFLLKIETLDLTRKKWHDDDDVDEAKKIADVYNKSIDQEGVFILLQI